MLEASPAGRNDRPDPLPALTGLRFIAAFTVLAGHAADSLLQFAGEHPDWCHYIAALPGIGMPLFFVLSGFVIHYNYHRSIVEAPARGTINFFVARFDVRERANFFF